jgi:signal transduction histidine kinase
MPGRRAAWDHGPIAPPTAAAAPPGHARLGVVRPVEGRAVAGVATGLAARAGVDPLVVRLAFAVLATAAGAGVVAYLACWAVLPDGDAARTAVVREPTARHAAGVACAVAGALLLLRAAGLWWADSLTWSAALAALGSAVVWAQSSEAERTRMRRALQRAVGDRALPDPAAITPIRRVVGGCLVAAGAVTSVVAATAVRGAADVLDVVIASGVTLVGVAVVVAPWVARLGGQVADERRERIRSEERAEVAAHLHDSVLQTLALIQRAESPEEVRRLARRQERELRTWLFGRAPEQAPARLGEAVRDLAGRVEDAFGVPVEVVLAGDLPLDEDLAALAEAAGEAMVNAAKHSGADRVDVFVEVEPDRVTAFVRDEGAGFDPARVADDRRGLRHSVEDRVRRHGGTAAVTAAPGEGTEVELTMPLPTAAARRAGR